jgi:hypothetical protein
MDNGRERERSHRGYTAGAFISFRRLRQSLHKMLPDVVKDKADQLLSSVLGCKVPETYWTLAGLHGLSTSDRIKKRKQRIFGKQIWFNTRASKYNL